jgi:hypothetical protein
VVLVPSLGDGVEFGGVERFVAIRLALGACVERNAYARDGAS